MNETTHVNIKIPRITMEFDHEFALVRGRMVWGEAEKDFAFSREVFTTPRVLAEVLNETFKELLIKGNVWSLGYVPPKSGE